jgi:hypothetical protein
VTLGPRWARPRAWWFLVALALLVGAVVLWSKPRQRAFQAGPALLLPDAGGHIRLRVAERVPAQLPAEGVPAGWTTKEFTGRAWVELVRDGTRLALRLRSERALDDQAAQVYVVFPRWPSPLTSSDVIGYVWDSRAPVGTQVTSTRAGNVRIIVVASGRSQRDTWRLEQRNVAEDYTGLFGRPPPRVGQVAVMIDTNDTKGAAETLIGDLVFARRLGESMEIPTSMLR